MEQTPSKQKKEKTAIYKLITSSIWWVILGTLRISNAKNTKFFTINLTNCWLINENVMLMVDLDEN